MGQASLPNLVAELLPAPGTSGDEESEDNVNDGVNDIFVVNTDAHVNDTVSVTSTRTSTTASLFWK